MSTGSPGNTQYSACGSSGLQVILAVPGVQGPTTVIAGAASGTVTSVALSVPSGLTVSGSPVTTSGTLTVAFASGHSIPTTASQATWDAAYTERRQWDGGATNLDAASGRTNLGLGTADSPVFAGLTVSGTANLPHIHGALAGVLYEHVRNTSGAPISALTPYYITGSQGDTDRVTIEPAQANNEALMPAAGITYGALSTNEDGHGAVGGVITGLNTIGFQSGDPVYVAPSGGLTATRPASGIVQAVGVIGRVHASTGSMAVLIGSALQAVAFSGAYGDLSGQPTIPSGADAVPQALGTAAVGVSNDYAREDHVHAMPTAADVGAAASGHVHGNITNAGAIGSVSGVPIITGTSGVLQAGSFGTASGTFAQGNDARFHDSVTLSASVADILSLSGQELQADDPGADRLLFWDDSEGKLTHAAVGPGIVFDGTTLRAEDSPWMALGDESTAATSGIKLTVHHWPSTHRLTAIPIWSATAPVISALQLDIRVGGTSIFSTLPTIAVGGTSSTTTTPAVFSAAFVSGGQQIAAGSVVTFHVTQAPSGGGGAGLKVQTPAVRI
jgi:hypothetical protein